MKINKVTIEGYKAFSELQEIELRPITLLVGKNSSGKSAIAKLIASLGNSLSRNFDPPLLLKSNGIEIGNEFVDLVYNKYPSTPISFSVYFSDGRTISVSIIQPVGTYTPIVYRWSISKGTEQFSVFIDVDQDWTSYTDGERFYTCTFKGILPSSIIDTSSGANICESLDLDNLNINIDYIGPFRTLPPRFFSPTGEPNVQKLGVLGENAYNILAYSKLLKNSLLTEVSQWFKDHFDKWRVDILDNKYPVLEPVLFKEETPNVNVNIVDVGQGMSQALPLVVRAMMDQKDSVIILEQPELHLHPAAHADLGELFSISALKFNHSFLIETHSENIILRLRKLIVDPSFPLKNSDVVIYFVEQGEKEGQMVRKIEISEEGVLSDWPEGVFNEDLEEILAIKKALKERKVTNDSKD